MKPKFADGDYEKVEQAAETIVSRGDKPTIQNVRLLLGYQLDASVIATHLTAWKKNKREESVSLMCTSTEFQQAIHNEIKVKDTQARLDLKDEIVTLEADRTDLLAENRLLSENLAKAQEQINELQKMNLIQSGMLDQLRTELVEARAQARSYSENLAEQQKNNARLEARLSSVPKLEKRLAELEEQLKQERDQRHAAELHCRTEQVRRQQLEWQSAEFQQETEKCLKTAEALASDVAELKSNVEHMTESMQEFSRILFDQMRRPPTGHLHTPLIILPGHSLGPPAFQSAS